MTFEEAIKKAIQTYWSDDPEELKPTPTMKSKYNKKYFDTMEDEKLPKKDKKNG